MKKFDLNSGWKFNIGDENPSLINLSGWLDAKVPGTVHTDLLENKIIDEPFFDDNELKQTWVSESDWIYRKDFRQPENLEKELPVFLVFEGIDTISDIYLNNSLLGRTENMFLKYEFEVTSIIKDENRLELRFHSSLKYARAEEIKYGKLPVALNSERVYIRKAQYSFGWDWGPSFPTMGIWKPVYLIQRNLSFINNISFSVKDLSHEDASIRIIINTGGKLSNKLKIKTVLSNSEQSISKEINLSGKNKDEIGLNVKNPALWWPNGEGDQNLYLLEVFLLNEKNNELDYQSKKVGIRTINLVLIENEKPTFRIRINGKPVYAKGANWIPADSFAPRVSNEKYRQLLQAAKNANMNIVRVWGGGFYENDVFYDICDELGLMVWQDFMFACAAYPEHKEFIENIKDEFKENVRRLQHHPSVVLWCGNNENEWIWYQSTNSSYKKMPGYRIYHSLIPKVLEEEDGDRPYWPTSPFGFDEDPNSFTSGNRHEWKIWSRWTDYTEVINDRSLFVTEFGFQGPADKKTFEKFLSEEKRHFQDKIFEFHNKQVEGPERIIRFAAGHLPLKTGWDDYIYITQLNQGLALKTCLEHWRFNYPVTSGSIIWQLNDCWPVASWAIIDSELSPKMSYYFVKNIFARQIVCVKKNPDELTVQLLNQGVCDFTYKLRINIYEGPGTLLHEEIINGSCMAGSKITVNTISRKILPEQKSWIIVLSLFGQDQDLIVRNFYTEEKWKYMRLSSAEIHAESRSGAVILSADRPAYFVDLYHPNVQFSDRGFILLPGEEKILQVQGNSENLNLKELRIFCLNEYLNKSE